MYLLRAVQHGSWLLVKVQRILVENAADSIPHASDFARASAPRNAILSLLPHEGQVLEDVREAAFEPGLRKVSRIKVG